MLKFRNLKTKRQIKNALLDMFNLKKVGTFWFKDKNNVLSIRVNASRGKVFLKVNLPQKFKVVNPNHTKYGFRGQFDTTEIYDTIIKRPSNEDIRCLPGKAGDRDAIHGSRKPRQGDASACGKAPPAALGYRGSESL